MEHTTAVTMAFFRSTPQEARRQVLDVGEGAGQDQPVAPAPESPGQAQPAAVQQAEPSLPEPEGGFPENEHECYYTHSPGVRPQYAIRRVFGEDAWEVRETSNQMGL